jgi:hypothetical protein
MDDWLKMPKDERVKYQPSKEMIDCVEDYYLQAYLGHTHFHPAADWLRSTPQINTWDGVPSCRWRRGASLASLFRRKSCCRSSLVRRLVTDNGSPMRSP